MQRNPRSEFIASAVLKKGLTPDGRDWFTLALDPFHDYLHPVAGFPDADSSHTVVSCFQYALDIAKPAGAAANWDCHIAAMPWLHNNGLSQHDVVVPDVSLKARAAVPTILAKPITVITADAGQPLWPTATVAWNPTNLAVDGISMANDAFVGVSRVIGYGFEVVNTTSDLYKQGALTAYRLPQEKAFGQYLITNALETNGGEQVVDIWRSPPSTTSEAVLLGGTKQWAAKDGVYMVVPLATVANPLCSVAPKGTVMSKTGGVPIASLALANPQAGATVPNNMPVLTAQNYTPSKTIPYCTSGVFLTGLSNSTTLRLKVKIYVERAPTFAESALSVLATPSAAYDAKVLQLYSAVLQHLPIAVPVGYNDAGDWWRAILDTVAIAAPALGTLIAPGIGTMIGGALGAGAAVSSKLIKNDQDKSKPAKPAPPPRPNKSQRKAFAPPPIPPPQRRKQAT